jgi:hypothetical protein
MCTAGPVVPVTLAGVPHKSVNIGILHQREALQSFGILPERNKSPFSDSDFVDFHWMTVVGGGGCMNCIVQ